MSAFGRRKFLKLGALFVPALVEPRRAYSFLWARPERYVWEPVLDDRMRVDHQVDAWLYAMAAATLLPVHVLCGVSPPDRAILSHIVIKGTISI